MRILDERVSHGTPPNQNATKSGSLVLYFATDTLHKRVFFWQVWLTERKVRNVCVSDTGDVSSSISGTVTTVEVEHTKDDTIWSAVPAKL